MYDFSNLRCSCYVGASTQLRLRARNCHPAPCLHIIFGLRFRHGFRSCLGTAATEVSILPLLIVNWYSSCSLISRFTTLPKLVDLQTWGLLQLHRQSLDIVQLLYCCSIAEGMDGRRSSRRWCAFSLGSICTTCDSSFCSSDFSAQGVSSLIGALHLEAPTCDET